jgi:hypothetical protein
MTRYRVGDHFPDQHSDGRPGRLPCLVLYFLIAKAVLHI